jgi:hypothetical protein
MTTSPTRSKPSAQSLLSLSPRGTALAAELADVRRRAAALRTARKRVSDARYRAHPDVWAWERAKSFVWSKQREILSAVRDHRLTAVRSCHGIGKSHSAALLAAWWIDVHAPGEAFVVTTAPTFPQVRAILWRYIRQLHKRAGLPGRVNQTEWLIDDELVAFGRKPADHDEAAFQGIHARRVLVILDEACGIPERLWIAADALTTNDGCRIVAIGNPDNPSTYFKRVSEETSHWHKIRISAFDSPNLSGEPIPEELRELLISASWVAEKAQEWGVDNPVYISKVLGEFPSDNPMAVVRFSDIQLCRIGAETPHAAEELLPVELGIDVGGGGDLTVIRERRGAISGREWTSHSDRPEDLAPLALSIILETGATSVKVDSIGIGWGLVGELRNMRARRLHSADIHAVNVGESASQPTRYANLRAELWWEVGRHAFEQRAVDVSTMANADTTIAELCQPLYDIDPKGRIRIESKDDIRDRTGGRSPDHADAWLLAFYVPRMAAAQSWVKQYAAAAKGAES